MADNYHNLYQIDNNEPCPCGSNLLYKNCCKKSTKQNYLFTDDILHNGKRISKIMNDLYKKTDFKTCLYPIKSECEKSIKEAHTLQDNGVLSLLCDEHQNVMVANPLKISYENTAIVPVSRHNATTFYGFCSYHDSKVFSPIETKPYIHSDEQNFLFAYRALAQEYHKKTRLKKSMQISFKENPSCLTIPEVVANYRLQMLAVQDSEMIKEIFDNAILSSQNDILETLVIPYVGQLAFSTTFMCSLAYDLRYRMINDPYSFDSKRQKPLFLSAISGQQTSYFIFSCLKQDYSEYENFFNDLNNMEIDKFRMFINNFIPLYTENIILSPALWNSWTRFSKRKFESLIIGDTSELDNILSGEYDKPLTPEEMLHTIAVRTKTHSLFDNPHFDLFKLEKAAKMQPEK